MADVVQFTITRAGTKNVSVPTWTISGRLVDSRTQQSTVADFSGANTLSFPQVLSQLTSAQQDAVVASMINLILQLKFGI